MPAPKNEHPTSTSDSTIIASSLSSQQIEPAFHQHLRAQIRSAIQLVMEEIMREELTQFLGATWGECTAERKGYRNGTYTRDLATEAGSDQRSARPQRSRGTVPYADL
jgi:putative transposase